MSEQVLKNPGSVDWTAALIQALGSDRPPAMEQIVAEARRILRARKTCYLPLGGLEKAVTSGRPFAASLLEAAKIWAQGSCEVSPPKGLITLAGSDLQIALAPSLKIALVPVICEATLQGLLLAGFSPNRSFSVEDHQAGCTLSGALGLRIRLTAADRMSRLNKIARQAAHDLNNILSGVVSYPELIMMQLPPQSPFKDSISLVHDSGLNAARLTQDFLTLARLTSPVTPGRISPAIHAEAFCRTPMYQNLLRTYPGGSFTVHIDPDLPDILGWEDLIPSLLNTLLHHAAQNLTGPGRVSAALKDASTGSGTERDHKGILIRIEDDGPVLSPKDTDRIFEPFYPQKRMDRDGSGLELYTLKKRVELLGGAITLGQNSTSGNRYNVFLPGV